MQTTPEFLFGDALVKKFLEQRVVGLGDKLDQLRVQFIEAVCVVAGGGGFIIFATAIGLVGELGFADDIECLVEPGAGVDRDVDREKTFPKRILNVS